ncbi:hypothetical protein PVK06_007104 [Gossypium arboreum]|uniref:Uncharacterized protein n=1 Tax=Gossypium arboreum TaxID=29729 RepID=A0ABR0QGF0_GOSAR|nr:hypothetical protein PVK06_007104 [Gossypium arboreum]
MKRDHNYLQPNPDLSALRSGPSTRKAKAWEEEATQQDCGMDELLAVLVYKVKTSNMAKVA